MSVAVNQAEQVNGYGVVYAGTEPSAIFRSEDRGNSWLELAELRKLPSAPTWSFPPRPWTSHIRWITPDPLVPGRIFAAAEAGALIRSLDGGQTWEDRKPSGPFDTHTLSCIRSHRAVYIRQQATASEDRGMASFKVKTEVRLGIDRM